MGALQILKNCNPLQMVRSQEALAAGTACTDSQLAQTTLLCPALTLLQPGLTAPQAFLFFESAAHNYLSISTCIMVVVPIVYLFSQQAPLVGLQPRDAEAPPLLRLLSPLLAHQMRSAWRALCKHSHAAWLPARRCARACGSLPPSSGHGGWPTER